MDKYITKKSFSKKWEVSLKKVDKMLEYIDGVRQCPYCKCWEIPQDAKAIYIPNRNKYKRDVTTRLYAYVIDAIALKMDLNEQISGINEDETRTIVKELKKHHYIILKDGRTKASLNHLDYIVSIEGGEWQQKSQKEKNKLLKEIVKTIGKVATTTAVIVGNILKA